MKTIQTIQCNQETLDYINHLESEISDAHHIISKFGVGKQHWSLAGRVELLTNLIKQQGILLREIAKDMNIEAEK